MTAEHEKTSNDMKEPNEVRTPKNRKEEKASYRAAN